MGKSKTKSFQTETKQLLQLMIHSLYSNKEIFLRELISNASDALDKLRFKSISSSKLASLSDDLKIKVIVDEENKTLTISDNGCLLYTSPSPRDLSTSRMPSSA